MRGFADCGYFYDSSDDEQELVASKSQQLKEKLGRLSDPLGVSCFLMASSVDAILRSPSVGMPYKQFKLQHFLSVATWVSQSRLTTAGKIYDIFQSLNLKNSLNEYIYHNHISCESAEALARNLDKSFFDAEKKYGEELILRYYKSGEINRMNLRLSMTMFLKKKIPGLKANPKFNNMAQDILSYVDSSGSTDILVYMLLKQHLKGSLTAMSKVKSKSIMREAKSGLCGVKVQDMLNNAWTTFRIKTTKKYTQYEELLFDVVSYTNKASEEGKKSLFKATLDFMCEHNNRIAEHSTIPYYIGATAVDPSQRFIEFKLEQKIINAKLKYATITKSDFHQSYQAYLATNVRANGIIKLRKDGGREDIRYILSGEFGGSYERIIDKLNQQYFNYETLLKEHIKAIIQNNVIAVKESLLSKDIVFISKAADLMFNCEATRNPSALLTAPMFFDLVEVGKYKITDLSTKFPMAMQGAVEASRYILDQCRKSHLFVKDYYYDCKTLGGDAQSLASQLNQKNGQILSDWLQHVKRVQQPINFQQIEQYLQELVQAWYGLPQEMEVSEEIMVDVKKSSDNGLLVQGTGNKWSLQAKQALLSVRNAKILDIVSDARKLWGALPNFQKMTNDAMILLPYKHVDGYLSVLCFKKIQEDFINFAFNEERVRLLMQAIQEFQYDPRVQFLEDRITSKMFDTNERFAILLHEIIKLGLSAHLAIRANGNHLLKINDARILLNDLNCYAIEENYIAEQLNVITEEPQGRTFFFTVSFGNHVTTLIIDKSLEQYRYINSLQNGDGEITPQARDESEQTFLTSLKSYLQDTLQYTSVNTHYKKQQYSQQLNNQTNGRMTHYNECAIYNVFHILSVVHYNMDIKADVVEYAKNSNILADNAPCFKAHYMDFLNHLNNNFYQIQVRYINPTGTDISQVIFSLLWNALNDKMQFHAITPKLYGPQILLNISSEEVNRLFLNYLIFGYVNQKELPTNAILLSKQQSQDLLNQLLQIEDLNQKYNEIKGWIMGRNSSSQVSQNQETGYTEEVQGNIQINPSTQMYTQPSFCPPQQKAFDVEEQGGMRVFYNKLQEKLNSLGSLALSESWATEDQILGYLLAQFPENQGQTTTLVSDIVWNVEHENQSELFPYEKLGQFISDSKWRKFVLPLAVSEGSHYAGVMFEKTTGDEIKITYFNPTSNKQSQEDQKVAKTWELVVNIIEELKMHSEDYTIGDSRIKAEIVGNFNNQLTFSKINNISCEQQISSNDCGYIVGQTLYELALGQEMSIIKYSQDPDKNIQAIAQARTNFVDQNIIGKQQADTILLDQYSFRIASAITSMRDHRLHVYLLDTLKVTRLVDTNSQLRQVIIVFYNLAQAYKKSLHEHYKTYVSVRDINEELPSGIVLEQRIISYLKSKLVEEDIIKVKRFMDMIISVEAEDQIVKYVLNKSLTVEESQVTQEYQEIEAKIKMNEMMEGINKAKMGLDLYSINIQLDLMLNINKFDFYIASKIIDYNQVLFSLIKWQQHSLSQHYSAIVKLENEEGNKHAVLLYATKLNNNTVVQIIDPLSKGDSTFVEQIEQLANNIATPKTIANTIYTGQQCKDDATCGDISLIMLQELTELVLGNADLIHYLPISQMISFLEDVSLVSISNTVEREILQQIGEPEQAGTVTVERKSDKLDYGKGIIKVAEANSTLHHTEYTVYTPNGSLFIPTNEYEIKLQNQLVHYGRTEGKVLFETADQAIKEGYFVVKSEDFQRSYDNMPNVSQVIAPSNLREIESATVVDRANIAIYTPAGNPFISFDVYDEKLEAQMRYYAITGELFETARQAFNVGYRVINTEQIENEVNQPIVLANNIHQAIQENNLDGLRTILEQGTDILQYNENNQTPLQIAVLTSNVAVARLLLESYVPMTNVEHEIFNLRLFPNGIVINTVLHVAVEQGDEEMIRLLVEHGANPVRWNINADTALHLAADREDANIARILLDRVQEEELINLPDTNGFTALDRAVGQGNTETAIALMEYGGNTNVFAREVAEMLDAVHVKNANINLLEEVLILDNGVAIDDTPEQNWYDSWYLDFEMPELNLDLANIMWKGMALLPLFVSHQINNYGSDHI